MPEKMSAEPNCRADAEIDGAERRPRRCVAHPLIASEGRAQYFQPVRLKYGGL